MPKVLLHHRTILTLAALLFGLALGVPIVNASAPLPRALFLTLPEGSPQPELTLAARRGADGRWWLEIEAARFEFSALCRANAEPVPRGHAHVIKDGAKRASAHAPHLDLGALPGGRHEFRVVLRGQDHRALVGRNGLIEARLILVIPADPPLPEVQAP